MNRPEILHIDNSLVDNAVTLWRKGALVALPTETVYGLGADATNGEAVASIYMVKARPQFNPLIVHVADIATAKKYVEWNDTAEALAQTFWPGPLTLVLKRRADSPISELVSAGGDSIAIRIPSHPVALQLLKAFGGGIAAPSANRSGRISPTTAQHVRDELGDRITLIIDGGACEVGLESTVLDVLGEGPVILRPGSITREMIEAVLPPPNGGRLDGRLAGTSNITEPPPQPTPGGGG
ncbi:MAG: L-threonylcarbamoyladenylate synthase, partial [Rickettsiales bacterium]